jgi:hypothetical protein
MESMIEQAWRHVRGGREIIVMQRLRIAANREKGGDTTELESLLHSFEAAQTIFEFDLEDFIGKAELALKSKTR